MGPGRRRSRPNLRAVISNGDFEEYWRFHLEREHQRLHPGTPRASTHSARNPSSSCPPGRHPRSTARRGRVAAGVHFNVIPGAIVTPLIMTSRLELRPFRPEDAAELHEIFSDPETHTLGEGPLASLAETAAWIHRRVEAERQHGLLWYAVRDRAGGRMLGNCGLFAGRTGSAKPEIGYEIHRSCQGQGLATEASPGRPGRRPGQRDRPGLGNHPAAQRRVPARRGQDRDARRHTRPDSRGPLVYLARP